MNDITAFFAFLKYCLGYKGNMSKIVARMDWQELYSFASKQALLGLCFESIERLGKEYPEELLLNWMGKVQQIRNQGISFLPPQNLLYPLRILMALLARSAVMPSYGLVRMKCGSCESCITYSSSIIAYRPSSWRLSAIHDAISTMILLQYQH